MKKNKIRVGIIGLGIGKYHLRSYNNNKYCEVAGICDFDKKILKKYSYLNIQKYTRANSLILNKNIDVISIASYDHYHFDQIMLALNNNKHVFVEKPICLNSKELLKINNLLKKKKNLYFSSNLNLRTERFINNLRNNIKLKKFGKIYFLQADYLWGRVYKINNTWRNKSNNYSLINATGVHMIDLIIFIMDKLPSSVKVEGSKNTPKKFNFDIEDFIKINLKFEDGLNASINLHASCVHPHFHRIEIYGDKSTFIHNLNSSFSIKKNNDKYKIYTNNIREFKKNKNLMIDNFIKSIKKNKNYSLINFNEIFNLMKICFACNKSLKMSKEIKIKY